MNNCMESAKILREGLDATGRFDIISKEQGVPLVAFSFKERDKTLAFKFSNLLRRFGWIVPAYTLPPDLENTTVLRVVIREDFGRTLAEKFLSHVKMALKELDSMIRAPVPTIRYTIEFGPGENAGDEPMVKVVKQEVGGIQKSVPLLSGKTKGVC